MEYSTHIDPAEKAASAIGPVSLLLGRPSLNAAARDAAANMERDIARQIRGALLGSAVEPRPARLFAGDYRKLLALRAPDATSALEPLFAAVSWLAPFAGGAAAICATVSGRVLATIPRVTIQRMFDAAELPASVFDVALYLSQAALLNDPAAVVERVVAGRMTAANANAFKQAWPTTYSFVIAGFAAEAMRMRINGDGIARGLDAGLSALTGVPSLDTMVARSFPVLPQQKQKHDSPSESHNHASDAATPPSRNTDRGGDDAA